MVTKVQWKLFWMCKYIHYNQPFTLLIKYVSGVIVFMGELRYNGKWQGNIVSYKLMPCLYLQSLYSYRLIIILYSYCTFVIGAEGCTVTGIHGLHIIAIWYYRCFRFTLTLKRDWYTLGRGIMIRALVGLLVRIRLGMDLIGMCIVIIILWNLRIPQGNGVNWYT